MTIDNRTLETIFFEVEAIIDHKTKSNVSKDNRIIVIS